MLSHQVDLRPWPIKTNILANSATEQLAHVVPHVLVGQRLGTVAVPHIHRLVQVGATSNDRKMLA